MFVSEQAVQAAHAEYHKVLGDSNRSNPMLAALAAALPFLQGVSSPRAQALEEAYRLGFYASAEGYNAEYPFEGIDFTLDPRWIEDRDRSLDAIRALSSQPVADGECEVDYEVICNGAFVAGSSDLADAKHYAAVYAQDGPVEIIEARTYRRPLPASPGASE
ncbi:hypothetical protein [Ochrobactrum sp. S1502_03]|uniref:hypothetical protein n=1 Tax=Ochrobactrum sp. S1502_03 TaxID=3108451 RepID=UPI0037C60E47